MPLKSEFLHPLVAGFERTISTVYPACLRSAARVAAASVVAYSSATLPRRLGCVAHNDHLPGVPSGTEGILPWPADRGRIIRDVGPRLYSSLLFGIVRASPAGSDMRLLESTAMPVVSTLGCPIRAPSKA